MTQTARPKIQISLTNLDKSIEVVAAILLMIIWILPLSTYPDLPEIIPIHYNGLGKADEFGHKGNIFLGPSLALICYIGIMLLVRKPHIFNYPKTITNENALKNYTLATRLIRVVKLTIVVVFTLVVLTTLQKATGTIDDLGAWLFPVSLGVMFISIAYFLLKIIKTN
ncbi:DUF1648 domain-containing protein [Aquimarina intermedia]|uniref:Uncharacterized protein DUF1648 n=1 Tax=Aquimarina intermedia TaxID=350814 RepID=A0A5S5C5C8_9FLAO|nr:DUF1648 domain-containing protein [Aquimarina intermedia]TYP73672.1 uncharacterized protein DUF1648 [Aquimarina intermedia]